MLHKKNKRRQENKTTIQTLEIRKSLALVYAKSEKKKEKTATKNKSYHGRYR